MSSILVDSNSNTEVLFLKKQEEGRIFPIVGVSCIVVAVIFAIAALAIMMTAALVVPIILGVIAVVLLTIGIAILVHGNNLLKEIQSEQAKHDHDDELKYLKLRISGLCSIYEKVKEILEKNPGKSLDSISQNQLWNEQLKEMEGENHTLTKELEEAIDFCIDKADGTVDKSSIKDCLRSCYGNIKDFENAMNSAMNSAILK